ncbi:putative T7SS-secreted protein [Streptomyces sp. NPDC056682]|uniref:putative T7SS-secreted protein n=1 Tax=Streptomyces sp. NPDC056682 TaxID=3345909 RepID=UPI003684B4BF
MGLGDLVNSGLGKLEDGWTAGKKIVGEGIDRGANLVGEGLDKVGAHDLADAVEHIGDTLASDLGASPGEKQLGESSLAFDLVHGAPQAIRAAAKHLTRFHASFDTVGQGMRGLDSSAWKGESADTFREQFAIHPTKWLQAADACEAAATALDGYAETIEWAQRQAKFAIDLYQQGKHSSEQAVEAYNGRVEAYNAAIKADQDPGPPLEAFKDPGRSDIERARQILSDARRQRDEAGRTAAHAVEASLKHAPAEPPPLKRLTADVVDGAGALGIEVLHFDGGIVKGGAGLLNFVRGLNPEDPYNLTHPADYLQHVSMTLSGLVSTAAHPERIPGALIDSFRKDPSEALGRLVPQLLGTDGMGLAAGGVRTAVREGLETSAANAATHVVAQGDELVGAEGAAAAAADAPRDWSDLARSTDHISEKAIHSGSVEPELAQEFLDDQYPWLKDINNRWEDGYTQNCAYTTVTVDRRLDGIEASAARREGPGHLPMEPFNVKDPASAWHTADSYDDVIRDLQARGEGARSAIFIGRESSGHFFNAVNTEHGVVFLDGQSGTLGQLEENVKTIAHVPYGNGG